MPYDHDRAFYRLAYPPHAAPKFTQGTVAHRVVDIGEGGFRYAPVDGPWPTVGETVMGIIEFAASNPLEVEGVVVRIQAGEIAVHCGARPIPLAIVLREQQELRRRFPFRP